VVKHHGEVIGINSAVNTQGQGIGFAIPSNMAQRVMAQLQAKGKVTRGYLGLVPANFDDNKRAALKVPKTVSGIFIDNVQEDTPADKAGLRGGDIITQIEGKSFTDPTQFRLYVADHNPGDKLQMKIWRDDKLRDFEIVLGDRGEYLAAANGTVKDREREKNWLGIDVVEAGSTRARGLRLNVEEGIVVLRVEAESPADGVLQRGDVVLEVDRKKVETLVDWNKLQEQLSDRTEPILFRIQRGANKTFVTITPK
ncbi:MAG: PDZ domain-containing protein, partial [bacterium]|nr:PDZ domain-containing protein [bacterium]